MKLKAIILSCLLACVVQLHAKEDPIDVAMDAAMGPAMERDGSTEGQIAVFKQAQVKWEARLNSVYRLLKASMGAEEFGALQQAQRAWLVYREKQLVSLESSCSKICPGTRWIPFYEREVMLLTRARVQDLEGLVELVNERGNY